MVVKGIAIFLKVLCGELIEINTVGVTVEGHGRCPVCSWPPQSSDSLSIVVKGIEELLPHGV